MKAAKLSPDQVEAERDAAYERGWVDSLTAYWSPSRETMDLYGYYIDGWHACAKYRWQDPSRRGVALDPAYRVPRS